MLSSPDKGRVSLPDSLRVVPRPLSLTLFGTIGTIVVVGTLVWVETALVSLPFSPPAAASEEKREILGTPQTLAGRLRPLHPRKRVRERGERGRPARVLYKGFDRGVNVFPAFVKNREK